MIISEVEPAGKRKPFYLALKILVCLIVLAMAVWGVNHFFYLKNMPNFFKDLLKIDVKPGLYEQDITMQYLDTFTTKKTSEITAIFERYGFKGENITEKRLTYITTTRIWTFSILCGNKLEIIIDFNNGNVAKVTKIVDQTCL